MKNYNIIISLFLIIIITFISFIPSLQNDFTNWDDDMFVTKNIKIQTLSLESIKSIFTVPFHQVYIPLVLLSYAVEYHFFKLNPFIYHTTNLVFHLLNCILVFWFLYKLTNKIIPSLLASILFGIHPLHVESVAWISERKDVISTFFFMGTLIYYLYYKINQNKKFYYISLLIFILSFLAKPSFFTVPFILILCDYFLGEKSLRKILLNKIPFLLLALLFTSIVLLCITDELPVNTSRLNNILIATHGLLFYITKTIYPVKLSPVYPPPEKGILHTPAFLLSPLVVLILAGGTFALLKYSKKIILFGTMFFLITISPTISMVHNYNFIANDHYMYIPSIGLFYMIGEAFNWLYFTKFTSSRKAKIILTSILTLIIITISFLTWERCKIWKDSMTLWNDTIKNYKSATAHNNRGLAYEALGESDKALNDFTKTLEIDPTYIEAYINRGNIYFHKGKIDKAIKEFTIVLRYKRNSLEAYNNLGLMYGYKGEYDRAINNFTHAIEINKINPETYINRGNIYYKKGDYDKAIEDYNTALTIKPDLLQAYANRAMTYSIKGEYDRAIDDYTQTIKLEQNYIKAYLNRGIIYGIKKDYEKSINDFTQVLTIEPDNKEAIYNRSLTYFNMGEYEKAIYDVEKLQILKYEIDRQFLENLQKQLKVK
ncbi:MAG: TPR repeat-containing protein YrrB [bacterium ADurb.Bin363]|nr:MAG: TPR repeat-containing protein YrrB [bacterium ADurb.Bin363]